SFKTEDAAPHAVQVDGNDRSIDALHDPLESAPERQQMSDSCDLSFGEDADNTTGLYRFARFPQCPDHFARALLRGNGNGLDQLGEWFDEWALVDVLENEKPNEAIGRGHQQHRINEGQMIRNEQSAA